MDWRHCLTRRSITFFSAIISPSPMKAPGGSAASSSPWVSGMIVQYTPSKASPSSRCRPCPRVPSDRISRAPPSTTSTSRKPRPIMKPSISAGSTRFLEANASARPMMAQLVVMMGRKMPRMSYSVCR